MTCVATIVVLVAEVTSLWTMTGVPVNICTYEISGLQWKERQVGMSCDKQPKKVPEHLMRLALANQCVLKKEQP